jgi:hypothetical protein
MAPESWKYTTQHNASVQKLYLILCNRTQFT